MAPITCKKLPNARTECTVTFSKEEVTAAEHTVLQHLGSAVRIPGFRPGKAPVEMVRAQVKAEELLEEMIRHLVSPLLRTLPTEHDLHPILTPKVELKSSDPLTVVIVYVERPTITMKGADKIKIAKKDVKLDEKDVERMVRYLVEQERSFTEVEREAAEGDQVTMDFHGTDAEGKEVAGIRTTGYGVIIGSKTLLPGFEDHLKGMKKGSTKSFTLTFPEQYHAEHLRKKPVTFHVGVTKVEAVTTPEFNDAFAKERGLGESAADVRSKIEGSIRQQEESADRQRRERDLFDAIRKATKVDLAPELIDQAMQGLFDDLQEQLKQQNMSLEEWMKQAQKKPEDLQKELREQAENRLVLRFGVEQLLDDRKIEVTDEEVKTALAAHAHGHEGHNHDAGSEEFEQLRWQKRVEKLVEGLLEQ